MKRLIITYRDNALFSRHMPAFVEAMKADGWSIDRLVVSAGESEEEAKERTNAFLRELSEPGYLVSDKTCSVALPMGTGAMDASVRVPRYLDDVFDHICRGQLRANTYEEIFRKVLQEFCANREFMGASIVTSNIADHIEGSDANNIRAGLDTYAAGNREVRELRFAALLSQVVKAETPICLVELNHTYADAVEAYGDDDEALIIVDRHDKTVPGWDQPKPPFWDRVYVLPPSQTAIDLSKLEVQFTAEQIIAELGPSLKG